MQQSVEHRSWVRMLFDPPLSRSSLVWSTLGYGLVGALWFLIALRSEAPWAAGLAGAVWGVGLPLLAIPTLRWMRAHEESPTVVAEGARRPGRLLAFYPDELPWPVKRYRADAFSVQVEVDGLRERWLPRYRTPVYDDPRVRVGMPLELRVLGDEVAIDWDATLAALPSSDAVPAAPS